MKKIVVLLSIFSAVFVLANDRENSSNYEFIKEMKAEIKQGIVYAYLYQSTCGSTFTVYLTKPRQDLNDEELQDLNNYLVEQNTQICSNYQAPSFLI